MQKFFTIFLICLFSTIIFASDGFIFFNQDKTEENKVSLLSYTFEEVNLNALSSMASYRIIEQEGMVFAGLSFPNGSIRVEYGAPDLPTFYRLIAIPEGADYEVFYSKGDYYEIDLLAETGADLIHPVQLPIPKSGDTELPFKLNEDIYSSDAYFPSEFVKSHDIMRGRGTRLLPLSVYPVQYNPVTGRLRVYNDINISIKISNADTESTRDNLSRYRSSYSDIYLKSVIGIQDLKDLSKAKEAYYHGEGLLIISHDTFFDALEDFVTWKEIKGYRVTVTKTSEIANSNTSAGIKAYIQNAYDNWDLPPSHIILVGSASHIPTFTGPHSNNASDQLYVFLDGDDYMPDAAISRFTMRNLEQLYTYLDKILYYEQFQNSDLSWMTDAALISGEDSAWFHIGEGTLNYAVDEYLDPLGWDYDKLYRHTYNTTKAEVIASMNAGKMIANFTAHCSPTAWGFRSGQYIYNEDVHALFNQDMYFYAIGNCCQSSRFVLASECIGEAFIVADNAAIAYWGASGSTYWYEDDILAKRSYDGFFAEDIQLLAPNSDYSKVQLWIHYGGGGRAPMYMEYYLIFGDGTTFIPKLDPTEMNVNAPPLVPSGSNSMTVSVMADTGPVKNAMVSAWMPDLNVRGTSMTDDTGTALVVFDNPLTIPGEFMLTVTHPNHINNISSVFIGTSSEGYISIDKELYNCTNEVQVMLMDADLEFYGTYELTAYSTSDPDGITVLMTETEFEGVFTGSFVLSEDLFVSHDDIITVEYYDENTGDGTGALITATAVIDCEGPDFFNIEILNITGNRATIEFQTDENARSFVNYGTDQNNMENTAQISTVLTTEHSGTISGLSPNTTYYFEIVGIDSVGNQSVSNIYSFKTLNILTIGDGSTELTHAPLYCFYHDNRTQVIYLASDLSNTELLISSIAIDVTQLPALTLHNWTIRMKHTDLADYSGGGGFETEDWTIVYQDDVTIDQLGWFTFELDGEFHYNGEQNLMIDFSFDNSTWQSPGGRARWTDTSTSRTVYAYTDSHFGDPLDWQGTSDPTAFTVNYMLNLELGLIDLTPDPDGQVSFDSGLYTCDSPVTIKVVDANVPGGLVTVTVTSSTDSEGINVILPETEEGIYIETIHLGQDIQVSHDDILTVYYLDEDTGDGSSLMKTDTAVIDCVPPEITNISVFNIYGNSAQISFNTDKVSISRVIWGLDCDELENEIIISEQWTTEHFGTIYGLPSEHEIFFKVIAKDEATNTGYSDCGSFTTANLISIGHGTIELTHAPLYTYFWKNRTSVIYRALELSSGKGTKGETDFYSIAINVTKIPEAMLHNFTIRLKHTDMDNFSEGSGFETDDWTVVYQADTMINTTGWNTFYFMGGPFTYDGTSNLMIDISFYNTSYTPVADIGQCYWTSCASPRTIFGYADSSFGDPLDWEGTSSPTATQSNHILNIQIALEESATPIPPTGLSATTISSTQVDLEWNDNSTNEDGFGIHRRLGQDGTWDLIDTVSANSTFYSDTGVSPGNTYYYRVYAFNDAGNSDYSNTAFAITITLGEALDAEDMDWVTYGDGEWFAQQNVYYHGNSSAQAGSITHNQSTTLETNINGPGLISFYWKVDSETNYDFLSFYINDVLQDRISGNIDWNQKSYDLPEGNNTITWTYSKDGSVSVGDDTGWVDYVRFETFPDASISSSDIDFYPEAPMPGEIVTLTATVRNVGTESVTSGLATFYHSLVPYEDLVYIGEQGFGEIPPQGFENVTLDWDTSGLEERPYIVTVVLTDIQPYDHNPDNNQAFIEVPLPVELAYFKARGAGNTVSIEWMTISEVNNLGWNIYRIPADKVGPFFNPVPVRLNTEMIPGHGTSSTPKVYSFSDNVVPGGKFIYILESVSTYGETEQWRAMLNWIM